MFQSEPSSSAVKFSSTERTNVLEKEAVLRFIIALAGSVTNESTPVLGHQNKLWVTEHKQVPIVQVSKKKKFNSLRARSSNILPVLGKA